MKNIYITWHYTNYGVAYLKHILSKFYLLGKIPEENIYLSGLDQVALNHVFDKPVKNGFLFDEVIYLTAPQNAFDKLSTRRFGYKTTILEDEYIIELDLKEVYEKILSSDFHYHLEEELKFITRKYPEKLTTFEESLWRNIQHYSIEQQTKWLTNRANFKEIYAERFKVVELNIDDLRNERQIAEEVSRWAKKYFSKHAKSQNIINVSLGSTETQVVWHILAESGQLPEHSRFIKTYDDKSDSKESRFKKFSIQEIPLNLVANLVASFSLYAHSQSPSRKLVSKKMDAFLKTGFSILLIGERGIGKSQIADDAKKRIDKKVPFKEVNCASFDDDSKAESELFGYEDGAFTGALKKGKDGLLMEADGGILFLDEIHSLSKFVQAKLMKALQTDEFNRMSIRKIGSNNEIKVECLLIFATNKSIAELKQALLPDFYDRIVQHVIHIPSLRETVEDRILDWENVWKGLKFSEKVPKENELINWLKNLPLYGNYRDLQKIAMYYNAFNLFDDETKQMIQETTPFQYAKAEFEKYHSPIVQAEKEKYNFTINQTTKKMIADYLYELQDWATTKFEGRKKAIEHFQRLGDTITEKTFNDWKNRKSLKNK